MKTFPIRFKFLLFIPSYKIFLGNLDFFGVTPNLKEHYCTEDFSAIFIAISEESTQGAGPRIN
jgi:hypothetical protein